MEKQPAVMETSFWVLGHRVDVLSYLFRFFCIKFPDAVRDEILAPDPRYPQRVYGYQEILRLLENQELFSTVNPEQPLPQFHAGEAAALALAIERDWWLLINEQRPLSFVRQRGVKAVTVPEFIVYLYETQMISYRSARQKLIQITQNTGHRVMQAAQQAFLTVAQHRGEA